MTSAYTIIDMICNRVEDCCHRLRRDYALIYRLDRAQANNETALHPDDVAECETRLKDKINDLLELAHELEMRRIEIKQNALQYQIQAVS